MEEIDYYLSLNYQIDLVGSANEYGDACMAIYIDFPHIKGVGETFTEAKEDAKIYFKEFIERELKAGNEIPKPQDEHFKALEYYENGEYTKALELFKNEAIRGNSQSMTNIALIYLNAKGVSQDVKEAIKWLQRACESSNASAYFNLGVIYERAIGVSEDINKAIEYYKEASILGHSRAQYNLAEIYLKLGEIKMGFYYMVESAKESKEAQDRIIGFHTKIKDGTYNKKFRELNNEEQILYIQNILNEHIRPILLKDGGDIELIDFVNDEIRLHYKGACSGCFLSTTSTFEMIREVFFKNIDTLVKVYIL